MHNRSVFVCFHICIFIVFPFYHSWTHYHSLILPWLVLPITWISLRVILCIGGWAASCVSQMPLHIKLETLFQTRIYCKITNELAYYIWTNYFLLQTYTRIVVSVKRMVCKRQMASYGVKSFGLNEIHLKVSLGSIELF